MGAVFKKTYTKAVPKGAEIITRNGERFAQWRVKGKKRTAPLTKGNCGEDRVVLESPLYVAKYRDGTGVVRTVSTGCKDETTARQWLAGRERRAERITAGMMTPAEDRMVDHLALPLEQAFADDDDKLAAVHWKSSGGEW